MMDDDDGCSKVHMNQFQELFVQLCQDLFCHLFGVKVSFSPKNART